MDPITRKEQYLARIAGDTDFPLPESPKTREEQYLARIAAQSGGTTDYTDLENKPSINGVELSGNKTAAQLNVAGLDESGKVPMNLLPPAAIERLVVVADDTARFALTTNTVQLGDTVKVTATNKMYMVIDTDHLDSESGYSVYVAGRAAEAVADEDGNNIKNTYFKTANIDSALSTTSENPVQNKVLTDALGGKVGTTDYATAAIAGIVKPDGITTTVDADGTIHAINTDLSSWYGVRDVVRRGLANRVFRVGDQLTCTRGADTLVWDIVDIDANGEGITFLMHETMPDLQFDAKKAVFAFPDGLAAGEYHFTVAEQPWYADDIGKTISFTLAQAIPEGGQLVLNNSYNATMIGATISSYASPSTTAATETVTMSEGSGGTDLGSLTNAGTPANHINSIQRALLGSNRWKDSAIRQMMNSDKAAGNVWTPQTEFDRPPSWASSTAGFLSGLEPEFLSVVSETSYVVAKNTVTDGGGTETLTDKFYLPSRTEIFGDNEIANNPEGTQYAYYVGATNADRIKYRAGTARYWWLRTPNATRAGHERGVYTSGAVDSFTAASALGWVPACRISKS